jgi:hypothetical protein
VALCTKIIAQENSNTSNNTIWINAQLDSIAYYDLDFNYNKSVILPDSIKDKMAKALGRQLPLQLIKTMKKEIESDITLLEYYHNKANKIKQHDTLRDLNTIYDSLIQIRISKTKSHLITHNCIPNSLVLACGNWGVTQALPLLRKYLSDSTICVSHYHILAAMAKLGDKWAYKELLKRSNIEHLVKLRLVDTLNWNSKYEDFSKILQLLTDINDMAYYLKSKELLLCTPDFLKIKGRNLVQFSNDQFYRLTIISICTELNSFFLNKEKLEWNTIIETYRTEIWKVEFSETKESVKHQVWNDSLSDTYIQKVIDDLKEWIQVNVEFY